MANEFNTIAENGLSGLGVGRTITSVRVVDDTGSSVSASPDQIREMVGIDYSLLTEQLVPGLFLLDMNGRKKQAYIRSFKGTIPTKNPSGNYADALLWIGLITSATILFYNRKSVSGWTEDNNIRNIFFGEVTGPYNGKVMIAWAPFEDTVIEGEPYMLTIMYTK